MENNITLYMNTCQYIDKKDVVDGKCNHPNSDHKGGTCWHIVTTDHRSGKQEFCKCCRSTGNIKTFAEVGCMEWLSEDWMITSYCSKCDKSFLFNKESDTCITCRNTV